MKVLASIAIGALALVGLAFKYQQA